MRWRLRTCVAYGSLRSDNGPEFLSRAIVRWLGKADIDTALIGPGKPWQNASHERFQDTFRDV